jgi:O-antigen/teichoic acid export membrane protein
MYFPYRVPRILVTVYAAHGLNGVLGVIAVPVALNALGVSGYGLLSIYVLLVSYMALADFGVGKNLLRILSESADPNARERDIRTALGAYTMLCAGLLVAFPFLAILIPGYVFPVAVDLSRVLAWMTILAIAEFALGVPASLMQTTCVAAQRFESYAKFTFASGLVRNSALLGAAVWFGSPLAVAAVLASRKIADTLIAGQLMGWLPWRCWVPIFDVRSVTRMLRQSVPLSMAQILHSTWLNLGSILVNAGFGLYGLGLYRAAFDLAGKISFISNGVTLVVFPRAARHFANESLVRESAWLFALVTRCSVTLYACLAAVAVVGAPFLLPLIGITDEWTTHLFILLVVALSVNAHSLLSNELLQAAGRYRYSIVFACSGLFGVAGLFSVILSVAGVLAIGWAWIGAALLAACVGDGLLLRICNGSSAQHATSLLANVAATLACAGLAWNRIGQTGGTLLYICTGILVLLIVWCVRDARPLVRARSEARNVVEPAIPVVCA